MWQLCRPGLPPAGPGEDRTSQQQLKAALLDLAAASKLPPAALQQLQQVINGPLFFKGGLDEILDRWGQRMAEQQGLLRRPNPSSRVMPTPPPKKERRVLN